MSTYSAYGAVVESTSRGRPSQAVCPQDHDPVLDPQSVLTIPCVVYAAKSTTDIRGSIPGQLHDCREALVRAEERWFVAEYFDEAASAFSGNRGPQLADAMCHAEELAREHGIAELWAQHSDRLARGDGRVARHAVEIALWALKQGVRVRTIQDPDTFRDLIYAVVTGQRNHEDSRRKGLASSAGRRRAAERGDYTGTKSDGYRLAVELDASGTLLKRLEIDPERQPAIAMLFRVALRGRTSGQVARALNNAGWLTKPHTKGAQPRPWESSGVLQILHNPRYAGLAVNKGEVVGSGHWPSYITPRQHARLEQMIGERWRRHQSQRSRNLLALSPRDLRSVRRPLHCHAGVVRADAAQAVATSAQVRQSRPAGLLLRASAIRELGEGAPAGGAQTQRSTPTPVLDRPRNH
jgi:DNA invertase Pin-like site-specific DNA recombinase